MNSIIRMTSRLVARPILERATLAAKPSRVAESSRIASNLGLTLNKRWAHNQALTYDFVRERILLVLRLFDKVDPEKLTLDSHFVNDLGLDSLDHVEIIMHLESEFLFDIPDKDAEKLVTPRHMLMYITDREEAYEESQKLHAHHHHDHHDEEHVHPTLRGLDLSSHKKDLRFMYQPKRELSSLTYMSKRYIKEEGTITGELGTSFKVRKQKDVNFDDIQARVMKVCSKYDKIDSSKLELGSHFVQDLGLDSLDHVEIMMELEDEFGLEIPDQEAEKLMRPAEIARFVFKQEEKRALQPVDRPF